MKQIVIDTKSFTLPFLQKDPTLADTDLQSDDDEDDVEEEEEEEDDDSDINMQLEEMQDLLPSDATFLGCIEEEVDNWTSWAIKDEYYIIPLVDQDFDWGVFRISWDDNFGSWRWSPDARIAGDFENPYLAAKQALSHLWRTWDVDLEDSANQPYKSMLDNLSK